MSSNDKSALEEAEQTIAALTADNQKLREELVRVNKERIEYLQNVSHQLVAPLNAIKWHIENITNSRLGVDRAKKVLRSIYSQSTIAVHLAKNFALMSNLESDHSLSALREPLQQINLKRLLVNLADDFQPLGWDKELSIEVLDHSFPGEVPDVWGMKPLLSQAFSNVIENAIKYSTKSTDIIIDGAYWPDADVVSATITNTGIPLPADGAEKIFFRGYRTPIAKNQYPAGTGFGLYIAKRIVDLHEGVIGASTDDSGRTIFEIVLPARALEGKGRQRG